MEYTSRRYNGDINVSNEKSLDDPMADSILTKIKALQKQYSIKNNKILLDISESSNQRKLSFQLKEFLEKKSFQIDLDQSGETCKGIIVRAASGFFKNDYVINILVGTSL